MTTTVTEHKEKRIARPLRVLVPLIKEDLRKGDDAARAAAMPHYQAAGEKLIEAKSQLGGQFKKWVKDHFDRSHTQANLYMQLAVATTNREKNGAPSDEYQSLRDFERLSGTRKGTGKTSWHQPVKDIVDRAAITAANLAAAELTRAKEREAEKKLALQLIDIGFKALATKLHPDKGGSRDAMQRLNRVRARLQQHA